MTTTRRIPRFVVILDRAGARYGIAEVARAAVCGGADVIQVREKELASDELANFVETVIAATGGPDRVAVNSHPEIAARLGTHLHLPDSFPFDPTSIELAPGALISGSIHGPLTRPDLDYAILGNVFETDSKPGKAGLGTAALRQIVDASTCPILAIGGIGPSTIGSVMASGAYGVAVRSYVIGSDDPEDAARTIRTEIDRWTTVRTRQPGS